MAGWVADKSWLLIMVLQIDSKNSATRVNCNDKVRNYVLFPDLSTFFVEGVCVHIYTHILQIFL